MKEIIVVITKATRIAVVEGVAQAGRERVEAERGDVPEVLVLQQVGPEAPVGGLERELKVRAAERLVRAGLVARPVRREPSVDEP